jgi:hypothetical protein
MGCGFVAGQPWSAGVNMEQQDYMICPNQPWLDGVKTEDGNVRQFIAARVCSP